MSARGWRRTRSLGVLVANLNGSGLRAHDNQSLVIVALRSWELPSLLVDGLPVLTAPEDRGKVTGVRGCKRWPVVQAEVLHRLICSVGRKHAPRSLVRRQMPGECMLCGFGVGFCDPVAAGLVALLQLLGLEHREDLAVLVVVSMPVRQACLICRALSVCEGPEPVVSKDLRRNSKGVQQHDD